MNGLGASIYNPAIAQIQEQLHASSGQISLSLSLFTWLQGLTPALWTTLGEFWGRKRVYQLSTALCTVGCVVAALSNNIHVLIGMRCIQATGIAAVLGLGAATLADIYEPHERGTMMGIYYSAPLLGPSLGPILGGALTQAFDWRATFWFLAIFVGICFLSFIPFKDTFRRERSLVYQVALRRRLVQSASKSSEVSSLSQPTAVCRAPVVENEPIKSQPPHDAEDTATTSAAHEDPEKQQRTASAATQIGIAPLQEIKLSLADVNPVKPMLHVLRRLNNLATFISTALLFGCTYSLTYTAVLTLANEYAYNALHIGLVLLAFGIGSVSGSVLGGRYSDYVYRKHKARNGGPSNAEIRLESALVPAILLPPSIIAYGWACEQHVNIAAICVFLFMSGFFSICIYSTTLAYIVDANPGRSASAIAANSALRGSAAFLAVEVAVPLQNAIGDGGLYSLWAGVTVVAGLLILLVWWKGGVWRETWEARDHR